MYESLRPWCNGSITVKRCTKRSGSGDKSFSDPVTYSCFKVDEITMIRDKNGEEYASTTQIYLPSEYEISVDDMILESGRYFEIHLISVFPDVDDAGKPSLRVIYL